VRSAVSNAIAFMEIQEEFGSFSKYLAFTDGKLINNPKPRSSATTHFLTISKDLKKRFKFVGSTVVYAYLQATGLINDHVSDCWKKISKQRCCIQYLSKLYTKINRKRTPTH
jgi:DNA-3-methyladenine glycosylase I